MKFYNQSGLGVLLDVGWCVCFTSKTFEGLYLHFMLKYHEGGEGGVNSDKLVYMYTGTKWNKKMCEKESFYVVIEHVHVTIK